MLAARCGAVAPAVPAGLRPGVAQPAVSAVRAHGGSMHARPTRVAGRRQVAAAAGGGGSGGIMALRQDAYEALQVG